MVNRWAALAVLLVASAAVPALAADEFGSPELIEAAKKEGKIVLYSANVAETERPIIERFNKRFPFVAVELVRAPGGQLITRLQSEAAAGKLSADVVDHSDRGVLKESENLFADYAPPNAADYPAGSHVSPKHWPRTTVGWVIGHNAGLVSDPPKSWKDLADPKWGNGKTGHVVAIAGGTTWTRIMFERQTFGDSYWQALARNKPQLYPSGAPEGDSMVRGEIEVGPILLNILFTKAAEGAPVAWFFPPEGIPMVPFAAGVTKTAPHPNAARLFMNWCLSAEGQSFMVQELGNFSSLPTAATPKGYDPKVSKAWFPDPAQFDALRKQWVEDWNKTFNYRQ